MRILLRGIALLFLTAFTFVCAADNPGKVSVPNVFSYQMPLGWSAITLPNSLYPTAVEGPDTASPAI